MTKRSSKQLTPEQRARMYVAAGGRCEFPGCNKPVSYHEVTQEPSKHFELAHNVAASSQSTRGHTDLSEALADDPRNILVLCRNDHRSVDDDARGHQYTVEELKEFKERHERRIERLLSIDPTQRTVVVSMTARVDQQNSAFDPDTLNAAVVQCSQFSLYPATRWPIRITLEELKGNDGNPEHHERSSRRIVELLEHRLSDEAAESLPISLFAIAPMADLATLGLALGNKRPVYPHQYDRARDSWFWLDPIASSSAEFNYSIPEKVSENLCVVISLSGTIDEGVVQSKMGNMPIAQFETPEPRLTLVRSPEDIVAFRQSWLEFLSCLRRRFDSLKALHIVPAMPAPLSIEVGRQVLPKIDPCLYFYDINTSYAGDMSPAIRVS